MSGELSQQGAVFGATRYIPRSTGPAFYVNSATGIDTNSGADPTQPFLTIGAALAVATAGSVIVISEGTYDENLLDISVDGVELLGEIGSILVDTTTGAQTLLISGNSCRVKGLQVAQAGQVGIRITGASCWIEDTIVSGATIAHSIEGANTVLIRTNAIGYTVAGVDISSSGNLVEYASVIGAGAATRGIYLSGAGADYNSFWNVASVGNATTGYEIVAGAAFNVFSACSSGGGDGPRVDDGTSTVWARYTYDSLIHKSITLDGSASYNLFQVTGVVQINGIWANVSTALAADVTAAQLDLFPVGGAAIDLTLAAGPDISAAVVNSLLLKQGLAGVALAYGDATLGFLNETAYVEPRQLFEVGQKTGGIVTYIRFTQTGAGASGVLDWHVEWEPLSTDGLLVPAP